MEYSNIFEPGHKYLEEGAPDSKGMLDMIDKELLQCVRHIFNKYLLYINIPVRSDFLHIKDHLYKTTYIRTEGRAAQYNFIRLESL